MSLVVDAGFIVAALVDGGADGRWAEELLAGTDLAAPHLMPVEAANILRRAHSPETSRTTRRRWRMPTCLN